MTRYPPDVPPSPESGNPADQLVLYGFASFGELSSSSSFSTAKLETYLRFQGLEYEAQKALPTAAPKAKVPYIKHGTQAIGDSELIIKYLQATYSKTLKYPTPTDPESKMLMTAARRICEEHLQFGTGYYRLMTPDGWAYVSPKIFGGIPFPLRNYIASSVRKRFLGILKNRGIADHNEKDFLPMLEDDLDALVTILGDKKFVTGDTPTEADASLFAVLEGIIHDVIDHPLKDMAKARPTLVSFNDRIRTEYYAEPTKLPGD